MVCSKEVQRKPGHESKVIISSDLYNTTLMQCTDLRSRSPRYRHWARLLAGWVILPSSCSYTIS